MPRRTSTSRRCDFSARSRGFLRRLPHDVTRAGSRPVSRRTPEPIVSRTVMDVNLLVSKRDRDPDGSGMEARRRLRALACRSLADFVRDEDAGLRAGETGIRLQPYSSRSSASSASRRRPLPPCSRPAAWRSVWRGWPASNFAAGAFLVFFAPSRWVTSSRPVARPARSPSGDSTPQGSTNEDSQQRGRLSSADAGVIGIGCVPGPLDHVQH